MKKTLVTSISLIICLFISACSTSKGYADNYEVNDSYFIVDETGTGTMKEDEELTNKMQELKKEVRHLKVDYPFLNFDNLRTLSIVYSDDFVSGYTGRDLALDNYGIYYSTVNKIIIFPQEEDELQSTILHELMHVITLSETVLLTGLSEGIADYLAIQLAIEYGIDFKCTYYSDLNLIYIYNTIFGEDSAVKDAVSGAFQENLDKYGKKGYAEKFASASRDLKLALKQGTNPKEIYKVLLDILFSVAVNYSNTMEEEQAKQMLENVQEFLIFEDEYLESLIENKLSK